MPAVKERPETLERPTAEPQSPPLAPPRLPERYVRWIGWMLALALITVGVMVAVVLPTDDQATITPAVQLERRMAKEAIVEHQLAVAGVEASTPRVIASRVDRFLWKDRIEEQSATVVEAMRAAEVEKLLERRLAKEAIEDSQQTLRP